MQNSVAKKIFALGVAASTLLGAAVPFVTSAAPHSEGTNVLSSDGTVWMVVGGQRRAYTSAGAFLSYGFNSFASLVPANADDLALPAGAFIPPQDGSIICSDRGSDKGTCYETSNGQKYGFTSAAVFTGLGFSFANSMPGDVSWMASGASLLNNSSMGHLPGTLINNGGTVQLVGANGLLGVPDLATFTSWGYSFSKVVPANAADKALPQTGVFAMRMPGQLSPSWTSNPNTPPVVSGSVSVSLASDNPAGGTIVASSSAVTLAKFAFAGNGTVTNLQVKRTGVSSDSVLSNVYLYDGGMRLTDAASVGGNSIVTFNNPNGLFTVSGNKTISVVAEIAGNATAGQTVGVQLIGFTVANGTPAGVAVSGNMFTISSVSDLATIDFGSVTPSGGSFDPASDVEVFRSLVSVGTRSVTLSRLAIRQIGSVNYQDLRNFRLRIDGQQVASVSSLDANGYASFVFSPVSLQSGTREFSILADIVGGSSRNFQFQIRNKVDVDFTDSNYGVVVSPVDSFPVGSASSNSINSGSLTFQKTTDSPSGDVVEDTSNALLAKYTVTAYGEAMKIETLSVGATSSDIAVGSLRNGRVLINGVQYGSTASLARCTGGSGCTGGGTSYTLNYTVQPGSPVTLEVRADIYDNDGTDTLGANDTVTAYLMAGSSNVQKMVSLGYASLPSSSVAGNALTVVTGSMTLSKNNNYASQTAPLPQTAYKVASFNLVGSSAEDIRVNSLDLSFAQASSTATLALTNLELRIAGAMFGTVKSSYSSGTTTFSGNYTLAKNQTVTVEVFATLSTDSTSVSGTSAITGTAFVSGTTINSGTSATGGAAGQTITYGSGSFTIAKDGSSPDAAIVADQQTKTTAAFKFTSANDAFTITEVVVKFGGSVTTVLNVILKDGATVLGTKPAAGSSVTFSGLSVPVAANSTKVLTVDLQLGVVGNGAGTSGEAVTTSIDSVKYLDGSGVQTTATDDVTGNAIYAFASIPTITNVALPSSTLASGTQTLAKFTVSSNGTGNVSWNKIIFNIGKSSTATFHTPSLVNADTNVAITGTIATSINFSGAGTSGTLTFTVTGNGGEEDVTSRTYALKATVGAVTDGDFISTNVVAGQSSAAFTGVTSTAVTLSPTFVWSDQSKASHSTTTADWFGDFLVKNIPTDSQTLSN